MPAPAPVPRLRWNVERRLQFIESRLYWEGRVRRGDLVDNFGISVPQASADLAKYQEMAPGNTVYDPKAKSYVVGAAFQPRLGAPSAHDYLSQLRYLADGLISPDESWLGLAPDMAAVPTLARRVEPEALRAVLGAIRDRKAIHVQYQSLSREEPTWRWLAPHALAYNDFRWHIRAWCHLRSEFQDFVFARILAFGETRDDNIDRSADLGWNQSVTLKIGPDPRLGIARRRAIELDYGMKDGVLAVEIRTCMVFYLQRQLGLDRDPNTVEPQRQQIVLLNREEVERAQMETRSNR